MKRSAWWGVLLCASIAACSSSNSNGGGDTDAGDDVFGQTDTGPADTGPADTGPADTGPADTGPADTGVIDTDTGPADTGVVDAGSADTGPLDTGVIDTDTGVIDTDTGIVDAGPADTGPADTGPADTGPVDTGPSCMAGEIVCGGACINPNTSAANCGACNNPCGPNQMCSGGVCQVTCTAPQSTCRDAMGTTYCSNLLTDARNCGACGMACATGQSCNSGVCQTQCTSGQQLCGSTCVAVATDIANCGRCNNPCPMIANGVATCAAGLCGSTCNTGFADCDGNAGNGCEADVRISVNNCGGCGRACTAPTGGSVTCQAGACVGGCPSGQTICNSACVALTTDANNCGSCGNRCQSGQSCAGGVCTGGNTSLPDLQIGSLTAQNCTVVDHNATTSDDRGGIAVSSTSLFYSGDSATGRFALPGLSGASAVTPVRDGLVSNLTTGEVFNFGINATTPVSSSGGTLTHLLAMDGTTGAFTGRAVALSQPIVASSGATGIFSGSGRALVYASGRVWDINLTSGVVTDRGARTQPSWYGCENWAIWGVAEQFGGALYMTYRDASTQTIVRSNVATGQTSTVATFSNLSDMCSFTVSPATGTWLFHYEGSAQFGGSAETVGVCAASFGGAPPVDISGPTFQLRSLTTNNCAAIEHATQSGDDRGGIAVTASNVLYSGDSSTARFSLTDLSAPAAVGRIYDALFSNLLTQQAYTFASSPTAPTTSGGGVMTHIIALDTAGNLTSNSVALSRSIAASGTTGFFSGANRVVVVTAGRLYNVALPSGVVTDLGAFTAPTWFGCENWAVWGVAEYVNNQLSIVYTQGNNYPTLNIMRQPVPTGAATVLAAFSGAGLSDMCSFTVSPNRNRWYFHYEGSGFARSGDETVGYCDATTNLGGSLRIDALSAAGCVVADHSSTVGDDRGGIALTPSQVLYSGDSGLVRHDLNTLGSQAAVTPVIDGIFSNLATQQAYAFGTNASTPIQGTGVSSVAVTHLLALDPATGARTGAAVALSQPIAFTGSYGASQLGIFSGMGRVVVFTNGRAFDVQIATGQVADLGAMSQPAFYGCENIAAWGVAENFGGALYMTYRQNGTNNIVRTRIPDGTTATVATFSNLSDLCAFTVSPSTNRWYFHHEGTSQFRSGDETIGFCGATLSQP
ncbi:MAG: hypothetical protein JNK72_11220 [Myxococcales bacterium]|nr:hypothetical protein [Myxococcales bacterium]